MLNNKTVIVGVTGSIAAYKTASLVSLIKKNHGDVHVIMTENATNFVHPITFETLSQNKCLTNTFHRDFEYKVGHIALADKADLLVIAPATANIIGKLVAGIADDMLTTTALAFQKKIILVPAMNTKMYQNPIVQDNIAKLKSRGMEVLEAETGYLACGDTGQGKMPEPEKIFQYIKREIAFEKDLLGCKILVTAGATMEEIDPVRFITNPSTGKMGFAIAEQAMLRGAEVTVIAGNTRAKNVDFVKMIVIKTAEEMFQAVKEIYHEFDIIIKSAAVGDYTPNEKKQEKIKKDQNNLIIELKRTEDILAYLGKHKSENQFICGFSMETENLMENAYQKLIRKNVDMIVANNLKEQGAGFATDTNIVTILTKEKTTEYPIMEKFQVAKVILDDITCLRKN